jgi:hypothetical protein
MPDQTAPPTDVPRLVIIESPYAAPRSLAVGPDDEDPFDQRLRRTAAAERVALHVTYARAAMHDALARGEAPLASHLLYTQPGVLDDAVPVERKQGIAAGLAWAAKAEASVFYLDFGCSRGMIAALRDAQASKRRIEARWLDSVNPDRCQCVELARAGAGAGDGFGGSLSAGRRVYGHRAIDPLWPCSACADLAAP